LVAHPHRIKGPLVGPLPDKPAGVAQLVP
jgi:hypothetical protein